ncbi:uncharacterized protein BO66DRAFT_442336 [Aspergillus aculeatinus CBS 121060]|uniref:Uncharacterized protein n=1 Tax=Aspergillus aculeatinus CBS 121060 TaxID=1448322 RepID=A0ACD1GXC4_9EURO|nr:hypothetical protein BO66DRAFT_442336 [Aspergillus aculeatinus CBS 121060]RAH66121.1 hypothetical protein BO66DRAFT_442336 [Aspergillus aculeatinus CBS 121060]
MSALLESPTSNGSVGRRRQATAALLGPILWLGDNEIYKTLRLVNTKDRTFQAANVTQLLCEGLDLDKKQVNEKGSSGCGKIGTLRVGLIILTRARAVLKDLGLDQELWGEIMKGVVFLKHMSPMKNQTITAWEALREERPNISSLRIIGCHGTMTIPAEVRNVRVWEE